MHKFIFILLCYISVVLTGCTYQEADIFSASPAERTNEALKDNSNLFQSAKNGWAMEYFATDQSAGYTMLIKFETSGQALIAGKSDLTKNAIVKDSSMYEIIADNGPVLTFNMYNNVLHTFSNPVNPDGYGLEGDYEFIVMKSSANQIILKGKKRGTTIIMNKLPENVSWTQYLADLDAMNSILFANNAPKLTLNLDSKYWLSNGSDHIFNILQDGANTNTSIDAPFIVTPAGIRFQSARELDGKSFQTFTLNADKSALECNENPDIKIVGPESLAVYFNTSLLVWRFDPVLMSPKVKTVYDLMVQSSKSIDFKDKQPNVAVKDVVMTLNYSIAENAFVLKLSIQKKSKQYDGKLYLTSKATNEDFNLTYNDIGDKLGLLFYNSEGSSLNWTVVGFKEMAAIVSSNFTLTSDAPINPQNIKFTNKTDADSWFSVSVE